METWSTVVHQLPKCKLDRKHCLCGDHQYLQSSDTRGTYATSPGMLNDQCQYVEVLNIIKTRLMKMSMDPVRRWQTRKRASQSLAGHVVSRERSRPRGGLEKTKRIGRKL